VCDPLAGIVIGQARRGTVFCAGALAAATACAAPPHETRVLVATIAPLADLLGRTAGAGWEVRTIVPPGTSPHVFEPLPRDVRRIAGARLLFTVGAGYDAWAARLVSAAASSVVVEDGGASVGVTGETDPHWWLSPPLAARAVTALGERLAALEGTDAEGFRSRAAAVSRSLADLDEETARVLSPVRGRAFISSHAAWVHFARRYGLREVAAIETVPGREPSPGTLVALIETARRERLTTLFTEPQFPPGAARVLAGEAGLGLALLDPIGGVPGRQGYEETVRFDAAQLARHMGERR
jgi:ABC-type Zn uptake system ZnuABC Zn-binding protein ZnuA